MRKLTSILLLICGTQAGAVEMWRWVDAGGVVHYSDRPEAGAERVVIQGGPTPDNTPRSRPSSLPAAQITPFRYTSCIFTNPANDQVFNSVNSVNASLEINPGLQQEHRIQVMLNGRALPSWPIHAQNYTLTDINRGSYTLTASIYDADGKIVCNAPAIAFHVRQPSLLSPARQNAAPAAKP
jgi:Domain of unknown function (DUF4124)